MSNAVIARRVIVHGAVQGVFFRDTCRGEANRLGVSGWVSNRPDGTVTAHFEGSEAAVDALIEWARIGPRHAAVDRVETTDVTPEGGGDFHVV